MFSIELDVGSDLVSSVMNFFSCGSTSKSMSCAISSSIDGSVSIADFFVLPRPLFDERAYDVEQEAADTCGQIYVGGFG